MASVTATARRSSTRLPAPGPRCARWSSSISTSADLARHLAYLDEAVADAGAAMLSRRRAMLAAYLVAVYADRLFSARAEPAADVLDFRAGLAKAHPALARIFDLVAGRAALVTEAVEVPLADYGRLGVEDFMVSLYNGHTVQRLRIVGPDGSRQDVHEVLEAAAGALLQALRTRKTVS